MRGWVRVFAELECMICGNGDPVREGFDRTI